MVNFTFRGLMAPVFTPFRNDEKKSLNTEVIPEYAKYLHDQGINGILVNGTTGEGVSQSIEEREIVAEAWMSASKAYNQTVMIQVGGTSLTDVRRLAAHAEKVGASSILCLPDLFHQPRTALDLLRYLKLVGAAAPNTPLLYYHIPGFIGIDINMKELLEKAAQGDVEIPTFVGIKFTCNDLSMGGSLLDVDSGRFVVFLGCNNMGKPSVPKLVIVSCNQFKKITAHDYYNKHLRFVDFVTSSDTILAAAFCLGFDSAIGTTLNMLPLLNKKIVNAVKESEVILARDTQQLLRKAVHAIAKHGSWVSTMKAAMRLVSSIDIGPVRDPLLELTPEQIATIKKDLKDLSIEL